MFLQKIQWDTDYPESIFGWFTLASLHTSESQHLTHRRWITHANHSHIDWFGRQSHIRMWKILWGK